MNVGEAQNYNSRKFRLKM